MDIFKFTQLFLLLLFVLLQTVSSQESSESPESPVVSVTSSESPVVSEVPASPSSGAPAPSFNEISNQPTPTPHITDDDFNRIAKVFKVNEKKIPLLKKVGRKINSLIDRVHAADGHLRPEILVHEFLPDPLSVKDIPLASDPDSWVASYEGKCTNVMLHGISGVKISSIRANVGKLTAKIAINVPDVYLTGDYTLDGSVSFVGVHGAGKFRMNISEIDIDAFGNLNRTIDPETGKDILAIGDIQLDISAGDLDLTFEGLSVGGSETIASGIVGTLSGLIFEVVKGTVLEKTSVKIRERINQRLKKIPMDMFQGKSESLFDDLLDHVTKKLDKKIEPLRLPAFKRNFAARMLILNVNASVNIYEGKLYGLTTFARTGDIWITYEEDMVTIEADVGFKNLTGGYNWDLKVLGRGPSGSASLAIRKIAAYMRIKQQLKRGSVLKLERFRVEEIDHVWMDMNGLGVWDYLMEIVVNTVSNTFRVAIANILASTVTKVIQEELEKASISFIP